jgi:penicillin-binding protein 2
MRRAGGNPDVSAFRLGVLGVVVLSLFATLLARLWYLQVMAGPELKVEAQLNSVRLVATEAPRGRILDREGRILVDNRVSPTVVVERAAAQADPTLVPRLAAFLGRPVIEIERRIQDPRFTTYKPVPVFEDLPTDKVIYLREHQDEFPGVDVIQLAQRTYPNGTMAAHVLGYVGEINDRELAPRRAQGYRPGDNIGKSGVEYAYETVLRGTPQVEKLQVDSSDTVLRSLGRQEAVPGRDVQVTIDLEIQKLAEQALAEGLEAARRAWDYERLKRFIAPAGAVVVLDPQDGSVLALASHPTYDPTEFVNGISVARFAELNDPAGHYPLTNRAIQGLYAPASTFKTVTAMAALERGLITARTTITDAGTYVLAGIPFRNAFGTAFGRIDLPTAIAVSSDVYFYWLGEEFEKKGSYGIQQMARDLGLGRATGIELPFEADGRIADPEVRRKLHEQNPEAYPNADWYTGDNLNAAIGQGETVVTPLQLANVYATFANGGTIHTPHLGAAVRDPVRGTVTEIRHDPQGRVSWDPASRAAVLAGLERVITDDAGTANPVFAGFPTSQFRVAGKTGTAQVDGKQDTALFAAFGPVESPRYVVAVVMEEAGFGASAAAPVARRVFDGLVGSPPTPIVYSGGRD